MAKASRRKNRQPDVQPETNTARGANIPPAPERPTFKVEQLEPRILMSATWVDADGADVLSGATAGDDVFAGSDGADFADGLDGNDLLHGHAGDDVLHGGAGHDVLHGGGGADTLLGGDGDDTLHGDGESVGETVLVGDLGASVTASDQQTGSGYIMYSEESVHSRFAANKTHPDNADHFITVKQIDGEWYYDNNGAHNAGSNLNNALVKFTPRAGDLLVAEVNFDTMEVNDLLGTEGEVNGIEAGYAGGDLTFTPNVHGGQHNPGEVAMGGTHFVRHAAAAGDDHLQGGTGDDVLHGGGGNDVLEGDGADGRNLIVNGSFEDTSGTTATGWGHKTNATSGWQLTSGNTLEIVDSGHGGVAASDGGHWLDLDESPGNIEISQQVAGVEDGAHYRLSFDVANRTGSASGGMEVYWNGELVATIQAANHNMESHTFDLIGGSGDGSNTLSFKGIGQADNVGAALDNVSLAPVGGNDQLHGGAGDDTLIGGRGDDILDGGDGQDVARFSGAYSDYDVTRNADGSVTVRDLRDGAPDGADTLTNVEALAFADQMVEIADPNDAPTGIQFEPATDVQTTLKVTLGGEWGNSAGQQAAAPRYEIYADGVKVGEGTVDWSSLTRFGDQDADARWREIEVTLDGGTPPGNVAVRFVNDAYEGKADTDRNLYVDAIEVNGQRFEAEDPSVNFNRGNLNSAADDVAGQEGMFWSGQLEFDTSGAPRVGSVSENAPGAVVGSVQVVDPDAIDAHTFDVSDGRFEVVDGQLKLRDGVQLDYEAEPLIELSVTATDAAGATFTQAFRVSVANDSPRINGTSGDDVLTGTAEEDDIRARGGDDVVHAGAGDDIVRAGAGHDSVDGGAGNDDLRGGAGDDLLIGGSGDDLLRGDGGDDVLIGGEGADVLNGGAGADQLDGGAGADRMNAGAGDDVVTAGAGDDFVVAGKGDDHVDGGAGNDDLRGGDGDDILIGGDGDDVLRGEAGRDVLVGGDGDDTLHGGGGADWIDGGSGNDVINAGNGDDLVTAGAGDDVVKAGAGNDQVDGGDGADDLRGGGGDDLLRGGSGDDVLRGEAGHDDLRGDGGNDALYGGAGDDRLSGGEGDDLLIGGKGHDTAVFSGNWNDYEITRNKDGSFTVTDTRGIDGADIVRQVEQFEFADGVVPATNVLNVAPDALHLDNARVPENAEAGVVVATVQVADGNALDAHKFELVNDGGGRFVVDEHGVIRVAPGATLDHEAAESHAITVKVTDARGAERMQTFTIAVDDVNEAPTAMDAGVPTVAEDAPAGTVVAVLAADDPDAGDSVRFELTGGATDLFEIVNHEVRVREGAAFDFDAQSSYELEVTVYDAAGASLTQTIEVAVQAVAEPEAPSSPAPTTPTDAAPAPAPNEPSDAAPSDAAPPAPTDQETDGPRSVPPTGAQPEPRPEPYHPGYRPFEPNGGGEPELDLGLGGGSADDAPVAVTPRQVRPVSPQPAHDDAPAMNETARAHDETRFVDAAAQVRAQRADVEARDVRFDYRSAQQDDAAAPASAATASRFEPGPADAPALNPVTGQGREATYGDGTPVQMQRPESGTFAQAQPAAGVSRGLPKLFPSSGATSLAADDAGAPERVESSAPAKPAAGTTAVSDPDVDAASSNTALDEMDEAAVPKPGFMAGLWALLRGKAGLAQSTDEQVAAAEKRGAARKR